MPLLKGGSPAAGADDHQRLPHEAPQRVPAGRLQLLHHPPHGQGAYLLHMLRCSTGFTSVVVSALYTGWDKAAACSGGRTSTRDLRLSPFGSVLQYLEGKAQLLYPEPADVFPVRRLSIS